MDIVRLISGGQICAAKKWPKSWDWGSYAGCRKSMFSLAFRVAEASVRWSVELPPKKNQKIF
jgi:hypothetical protein